MSAINRKFWVWHYHGFEYEDSRVVEAPNRNAALREAEALSDEADIGLFARGYIAAGPFGRRDDAARAEGELMKEYYDAIARAARATSWLTT